jgi:glutathione S-transferase
LRSGGWIGSSPRSFGPFRSYFKTYFAHTVAIERNLVEANRAASLLDAHLATHAYVAGASFTIGDIPVGTIAHRWLEIPDIERPPLTALREWRARLAERPGFKAHVMLPLS